MARDDIPVAYTEDFSRFTDLELFTMYEDETDPDTKQLLSNECKWRATAYCMSQEAN
jgi:hypothetical protein